MEEWREITGACDYMISNKGRVKSLKRGKERILSDRPDGSGYLQVILCMNGVEISHKVHKLVMNTFIPNSTPLETPFSDHIDRNRKNNSVENLRWVNRSTNMLNTYRHFRETYGIVKCNKNKDKFKVQLNVSRVMTYLGVFETLEEAKNARDNFLRTLEK